MRNLIASVVSLFVMTSALAQTDPNAKINLEAVAPETAVAVGEEFEVPIMMAAATTPQRYFVSDIIFGWDTTKLEFIGLNHVGSHPLIWVPPSGMPCPAGYQNCAGIGGDYTGLNEAIPPADGNGLYYGYGQLGYLFMVYQQPVQIVRFKFKVLQPFTETTVRILPEFTTTIDNQPLVNKTVVYGSYVPGMSVLGTITDAVITGVPQNIVGDINGNGSVGSEDMALLLAAWGTQSFESNPADLNGDGTVNSQDLAILITNWS
jgi:hypothetical protein